MMKIFLYFFFLIPLIFLSIDYFLYQFLFLFIMIFLIFFNINSYFSMISYNFGIDLFSFGLIILSIFISCLMLLSFNSYRFFLFLNMVLCLCLMFIFSLMNMMMMYLSFEFSLIPLILMILGWGNYPERLISGLYLFFYTLFASLPLFLAILFIYNFNNNMFFDLNFYYSLSFYLYFCIYFAFLVKFPMFMLHFWLPKAHVQAPIFGSMILAGLLLKIGGYGFIRFMFLFDNMFISYSYILYSISIFGCFSVSLICFIQSDMKCLIAYSSVVHMSFCLLGILGMTKWGIFGCFFMMIGHGLCSSGLFCLANMSYLRFLSRSFFINKGLVSFMPGVSFLWFLFCCFNMGCPPSVNFLSEFMLMTSMISYWSYSYIFIFMISFFSAVFSFYLYGYVNHGFLLNCYSFSFEKVIEYLLIIVHLIPIIYLLLIIDLFVF
uniref:NADH dehydrogenase subunit 4 n=1 Tax=Stroggylocephalus agrestis TaxID=3112133 RepID=UPI002E792C0A|nr:NADH dehydrogenase subunit 4 [Stroggylocephalus agrestis]WRK21279.1 NADH dehydrogenase subunit 4 [Stroggylocephalus agrestis]